jgi:hypothetical protein
MPPITTTGGFNTMKKLIAIAVVLAFALVGTVYAIDVKTGSTTGTAARINVSVGYTPSYVKVCNYKNKACLEWWSSMQLTTDNTTSTSRGLLLADNNTLSYGSAKLDNVSSTTGILKYTGSSSASVGFTIDNNTLINRSGDTIFWMAVR